ncbi:MAG: S-methyl-5-thioribose-1-phosphate isomerase, partial [Rhodothermales bacterium]
LARTRPTAVNLFFALDRMHDVAEARSSDSRTALRDRLLEEAKAIHQEDLEAGLRLGENGLSLFEDGMTVLTHCNAGGMATSGYGTALAPFLLSKERGVALRAFVDETRPLLQGSRITAWELTKARVPATLITDSMAGHVMQQGRVDAVIVGADRIAANGDVANKIGTYSLAVLADAHGIPFYVSAPLSTIDMNTPTGADIVIEERERREVTHGFGRQTAPGAVDVYNPAFDVTPARLVTAIITERGVVYSPNAENLKALTSGVEVEQ